MCILYENGKNERKIKIMFIRKVESYVMINTASDFMFRNIFIFIIFPFCFSSFISERKRKLCGDV